MSGSFLVASGRGVLSELRGSRSRVIGVRPEVLTATALRVDGLDAVTDLSARILRDVSLDDSFVVVDEETAGTPDVGDLLLDLVELERRCDGVGRARSELSLVINRGAMGT